MNNIVNEKDEILENQVAKEEIDVPLNYINDSESDNYKNTLTKTKLKDKSWFNTIEGHKLLLFCIVAIMLLYFIEICISFKSGNNGSISEIGKIVIEIFKMLIFSLTGYLFGTHGKSEG